MHVDVHSHLFLDVFDEDRDEVIQSAVNKGVRRIVNNGLDYETNKACIALADDHDSCVAAAGLYPGRLSTVDDDEQQAIFEQFRDDDVAAIGEIGLDYGYADDEAQRRRQRQVFKACVRIGKEERKPLIIHSRNAEADVIDILHDLQAYNPILHAFTGRRHLWRRGARRGYYFSVPPVAMRANQFRHLVEDIPLHQLFTESDAPYLSQVKDKRCSPGEVADTVSLIESVKGADDAACVLGGNYDRVFTM